MKKPDWKGVAAATDHLPVSVALKRLRARAHDARPESALVEWGRRALGLETRHLDEWFRRAWWGRAASYAIGLRLMAGRAREVEALIEPPDLWPARALLAQGRGLILAGAHVGSRLVAHHVLVRAGLPVRAITNNRRFATTVGGGFSVADTLTRAVGLTSAAFALRDGQVVHAAADGRHGRRSMRLTLLGHRVTMYRGLSTLARVSGAPAIPVAALWTGRRLRVCFGPSLPSIEPACLRAERGWIDAYLRWMEDVLRGPAENLRLVGGLWRKGAGGFF